MTRLHHSDLYDENYLPYIKYIIEKIENTQNIVHNNLSKFYFLCIFLKVAIKDISFEKGSFIYS